MSRFYDGKSKTGAERMNIGNKKKQGGTEIGENAGFVQTRPRARVSNLENRNDKQPKIKMKISKAKLIECAKRSNGIVTVMATLAELDRRTVLKYMELCPEAKKEFQSARETILDMAENNFIRILSNQNHKNHFEALCFALKTLGKQRGYTERIEQELSAGVKIKQPGLKVIIEK